MKLFDFLSQYANPATIVQKLRQEQLLSLTIICEHCMEPMTERATTVGDGTIFYCWKRTCRKNKSIRNGSFFEQSRLSLCESMLFVHLWSKGYSEKLIIDDFEYSNKTVVDWARFCRDICVFDFESDETIIGGEGSVVEIDETLIVKRKYNRGRSLAAGWLFGGIERRDDGAFKSFMMLVYDRSELHLTSIIQRHVAPGTHIITDGWAAYRNLSSIGYSHSVVIHEENFVSPIDVTVHTQTIESTWCSLKRFIRAHGTNKGGYYLEYICEYIFRRKNADVFTALLDVIRRKYPLH